MPPMKIQPIDIDSEKLKEVVVRNDSAKPVLKTRLKRLFVFDRQFPSLLKTSSSEKPVAGESLQSDKDGGGAEFEPSSFCLAKMVQNFIEESNEKQAPANKYGRNRCNCFNGNSNDISDDEFHVLGGFGESITSGGSFSDANDLLKNLIPSTSAAERNLLADIAKIVEKKNKVHKRKDDMKKIVTEGLSSLGYNSSICKSRWDKTPSYPAGEYEYIDVIVEGERLLIDIDFRSEFEIARSTGTYKAILQSMPYIFVGKPERLCQIVSILSEAAKQSLKKKGLHVPPWRKADYMLAKWLSPSLIRAKQTPSSFFVQAAAASKGNEYIDGDSTAESDGGELDLIFGERASSQDPEADSRGEMAKPVVSTPLWRPLAVKPKSVEKGAKVVTGLACLLKDKP